MNRWILLVFCIGARLHAETCFVTGTVLAPPGAAVPEAAVHTEQQQTVTDSHGSFTLGCHSGEPYNLTVDANGFAQSTIHRSGTQKLVVHLRIAEVHTDIEVGESSGVSVDADHGAGTH